MGRKRSNTRRRPKSNPRGVLNVQMGGYGFVKTAEGDFFIPESKMGAAFDGDLVEIVPLPSRDRTHAQGGRKPAGRNGIPSGDQPAARVVAVLDRAHDTVIGRYEVAEPFGVVVPEDSRLHHDIFTMRADNPDIPDGSMVRVRVTQFPTRHSAATGVIEEVIGAVGDGRTAIDLIVARHKLETEFSAGSLFQAAQSRLDVEGALREGYRDLRDRFVMTIDPADAKDFDDALSLEILHGETAAKWRLGVHIADVSHYVPWGSSIDLDARRRATSTYLVDRVIPMLPHELSDDLCSLKPDEDRRSFTVDMVLDARGELLSCDLYPALIRSNQRLSYEQAQELLESDYADQTTVTLKELSRIAHLRDERRKRMGGIDFLSREAKVRLDSEGRAVGVDIRVKTDATQLVEEAMILANETVAGYLNSRAWPCVYRVHEQPAPDSIDALIPVLQEFPWFKDVDALRLLAGDSHAVADVLRASAGRSEAEMVSSLVLRSMKRADYRPECQGHYGLASPAYAHFTSPIRRYPDLLVHRMLRAQLQGVPADFDKQKEALGWLSEHSSKMERVAEQASRESQEYKLIEYMQQFLGQSFSGVVSGVMTYGLYVTLDNTAEGLLPIRYLGNEYFAIDAVHHCLIGEDSGRMYRLGQRIAVSLEEAEPRTRTLTFRLKMGE